MKSFKSFITEKLKVTTNNPIELKHIANMLSYYIKALAFQNDATIKDIIDKIKEYTVYNCLSYWDGSVEEFIQYFNNNSVKKYNNTKELEMILADYNNELAEMVLINLNR